MFKPIAYFVIGLFAGLIVSELMKDAKPADARGTLEPTINKWEKKLGIPVPEVQDDKRD